MLIIHDSISANQILYLSIIRTDGICFNEKDTRFLENFFILVVLPLLRDNIPTSKLIYEVNFFGHNDSCAPIVGYFLNKCREITLNDACNILNSIGLLTSRKERWQKKNLHESFKRYKIEDKILRKSPKEVEILTEFIERVLRDFRSKS